MSRTFTRDEVLERLRARVATGYPILVATAGNGLIARSLEAGGVDLLLTSVTGVSRQRGLPSIGWRMSENNDVVAQILDEIGPVITDTPLIASIAAGEPPVDADLRTVLQHYQALGYSGVLNYPTVGGLEAETTPGQHDVYLERAARPDATEYAKRVAVAIEVTRRDSEQKIASGRGFSREIELIRAANELNMFTLAYAWTPAQAVAMVDAGADVLIGHCGGTAGGAAGEAIMTHEEAAAFLSVILGAAREASADVLLMGHGGPFATPQDTERLYELTDAVGFLSGSAVERIPVERAVKSAVEEFRGVALRR